jgi:altronate dehydratase
MNDRRLLRLHPADNVVTVIVMIGAGEEIVIEGTAVRTASGIPLGHKVATRAIATGEKVLKYGVPIGSATRDISPGEHVHTHNLKSDYLPTWLRENQREWFAEKH